MSKHFLTYSRRVSIQVVWSSPSLFRRIRCGRFANCTFCFRECLSCSFIESMALLTPCWAVQEAHVTPSIQLTQSLFLRSTTRTSLQPTQRQDTASPDVVFLREGLGIRDGPTPSPRLISFSWPICRTCALAWARDRHGFPTRYITFAVSYDCLLHQYTMWYPTCHFYFP